MKSSFRARYGGPEILEVKDVPRPSAGPGEVLVRVRAATVSRTDCGNLWGAPFIYRFLAGIPRPRHFATGCDFAGEVEAVGEGVTAFRAGDRVWGFDDNGAGTHATYLAFSTKKGIATIPDGLDFAQAAACAEGAHYAINFLRQVPVATGARAIVNGATGAIGSAAVQLLKAEGVHVTAVCATPQVELVRGLGADRVLDYLQGDFTAALEGEGERGTFDFVVDAVGKSRFRACASLLKRGGSYLSAELGPHGENIYLALAAPLLAPLQGGRRVKFPFPLDIPRSLARMSGLVERGQFRPVIDRRYPLAELREAFSYVASGQKIGNVVVDMP